MRKSSLLLITTCTAICFAAPVVAAQGKILLKRKYQEGTVTSRMTLMEVQTIDDDGDPDTDTESGSERTVVKSVARDGTVILAKTTSEDSVLVKLTQSGRVLEVKTLDDSDNIVPADGNSFVKEQLTEVLLPTKPVSFGETWTTILDNQIDASERIHLRTTLVGLVTEDDRKLLLIKQTGAITDESNVQIYRGKFWLDPVTNLTVKSLVKIRNADGEMLLLSEPVRKMPAESDSGSSPGVVIVEPRKP